MSAVAVGKEIPRSSRNVGAMSIHVVNDRLKPPGAHLGLRVTGSGILTIPGTLIPPWVVKHLKSREGAVEAEAQSGPSLEGLFDLSYERSPEVRTKYTNSSFQCYPESCRNTLGSLLEVCR